MKRDKISYFVSVSADHLLFALAMSMLIPPIPSMEGQIYSFWGSLPFMMLFLCASRWIAIRRGDETWLGLLLKSPIFLIVGFTMYARVNYPPI
jgi:hypothetical protein